jgi:hypothetical protein
MGEEATNMNRLMADKPHYAQILQALASVVIEIQSETYELVNPSL